VRESFIGLIRPLSTLGSRMLLSFIIYTTFFLFLLWVLTLFVKKYIYIHMNIIITILLKK